MMSKTMVVYYNDGTKNKTKIQLMTILFLSKDGKLEEVECYIGKGAELLYKSLSAGLKLFDDFKDKDEHNIFKDQKKDYKDDNTDAMWKDYYLPKKRCIIPQSYTASRQGDEPKVARIVKEETTEKKKSFDPVSHPSHYTEGRQYEPRKVIDDWGLSFYLGNVVKYISRAGRKNNAIEDLKKARQYLDWEIEKMEKGDKAE